MVVNPDRKHKVEPRSRLAVYTDNFRATPEAKTYPNLMFCILLYLVETAERWDHVALAAHGFHIASPRHGLQRGYSTINTKGLNFD